MEEKEKKVLEKNKGIAFKRQYTKNNVSVYDMFEYDYRTSVIRNPNGEKVFELTNVEVPKKWSQIATDILAQKYFRKAGVPQNDGTLGRETSIKQVAHRLADCWRKWGEDYNYFASKNDAKIFYDELVFSILSQSCAPNSPQWFNTGLFNSYGITGPSQGHYFINPDTKELERSVNAYERPQPHACARGNTKIFTNKGIFNIKYVVDNFEKLNPIKVFDGNNYVDIIAAKNNGVKDIFKMSLKNGNYIEFTNDHQIMASDKRKKEGGKYDWEELAFCLGKKVMQYSDDASNCDILPEVLKIESAELIGYAVGDGYHGRYKQKNEANEQSQFGVITINDEEFKRVTDLFNDIFGGYSVYNDIDINENYNTVKFDHKSVNKFCDEYDFTNKKSINKIVPEKVFSGSSAVRRAFLNGLFQADGCVRVYNGKNSGDVTLTTISEQLAHDVQTLLLSVGIYSRIDKGVDKRKNRAQSYYVRISNRSETIKFQKIIGFTSSDKREKLKKLNSIKGKTKNIISEETVSSIEYSCTEEVYDIQTTTGQFCANGILVHNCFILSIDDDLVNEGGIMDLWVREARIFKYGSGVGTNYSNIRAEGEKLGGGGTSSGLMSFLKIGDRSAGAIKSGGTTRRAAKMVCLDLDHPEVTNFIDWKVQEEDKVAALIAAGYPSDYEGEAYKTVSGQNSNNSLRIPNSFFQKLTNSEIWEMTGRKDGKVMKTIPTQELWDKIAYSAWRCADPGTQYDTTINEWHTCPEGGKIRASNPCSEYMFLDNTACNLASLNLRKFFNEETSLFDVVGFEYMTRLWTVVLEISVLMAQFPSPEVARLSYQYRTLGLGFANLGSMLMVNGIAYDSEEGRAIGGAISSIMTGISYKTSAEMAGVLGAFEKYEENKEHMMRVIRNHKNASYNDSKAFEDLEIKPICINPKYCPDYLMNAAQDAWDGAIELGTKYGYRNAQATVIAPTGTIGLVMDCDTTGVEPDFALVKFKKLSGGGYFKIINQSIPASLKKLGYSESQIDSIVNFAIGHGEFNNAPFINHKSLIEKGFTTEDIKKLDTAVENAFDIAFVFNRFTLGDDCMKRLGFKEEQYENVDFNLLAEIGFKENEIDLANDYVCGTMTVEGAPFLKNKHLSVFDCANKCGKKGERFIHYKGHIKMMAAVQPFISGAISKTINLPNEATIDEIKECYLLSWQLGVKACALYRDGSKLSQPLSNKSDKKEEKIEEIKQANISEMPLDEILVELSKRMKTSKDTKLRNELSKIIETKKLPAKRGGFSVKAKINGQPIFLRTAQYNDGTLGEISINMSKEGATMKSLLNSFAIATSLGLQYGVPLEEFVDKFTFTRFEPAGIVEHPNIKTATSVLDYTFRLLAYEYLNREDLIHVPDPEKEINNNLELEEEILKVNTTLPKQWTTNTNVKKMLGTSIDAPACSSCGNITLRNGTCYMCPNCGTTTGCS